MSVFNREKLKEALKPLVIAKYKAQKEEKDLYRNTLDCFSAVIEASISEFTLDDWLESEAIRQAQKTLQNEVGNFQQAAFGAIEGVEDLGVGGVVDLIAKDKKVVAEIKNKWNTTKGNHKTQVYDDLLMMINANKGFTGYYVEILSRKGRKYNKPFTPSDNKTKQRRPTNKSIRVIDGRSFYELLTGNENALKEIYLQIPDLTAEILDESLNVVVSVDQVKNDAFFPKIFDKVFP